MAGLLRVNLDKIETARNKNGRRHGQRFHPLEAALEGVVQVSGFQKSHPLSKPKSLCGKAGQGSIPQKARESIC
jgi:hypothetical protein